MTLRTLLLAPLLLVSACGGDGVTLRGTLRPDALSGSDSLSVLAGDGSEPVEVREGAFEVSGVPPGAVTLRFARGGDTTRMEIGGLPEEGEVELRAIRLDDGSGLAFPSAVAVPGGGVVTVNGLRYGGRLPERVAADGTVLAASDDADAFLVRPVDTRLPDLRVVVGPLTQSVTPDGDPLPLREVEPGDSVRVEGAVERGYVVASRITGPREPAPREGEDPEPRPVEDAAPPEPAPDDDPAPREEDRGGDDREGGEAPRVERDSGEPAAAPERGRGRGKGRGEERGRGKGGEKKGKG